MILLQDLSIRPWRLIKFHSELVEHFEGGFATDGSEVGSLKEGVLVINIVRHSR